MQETAKRHVKRHEQRGGKLKTGGEKSISHQNPNISAMTYCHAFVLKTWQNDKTRGGALHGKTPPVHACTGNSRAMGDYWCCSRRRSFTVFTGLNVESGTSTKTVFQSLIAPFHSPGSSSAFSSRPFLLLLLMKPVVRST